MWYTSRIRTKKYCCVIYCLCLFTGPILWRADSVTTGTSLSTSNVWQGKGGKKRGFSIISSISRLVRSMVRGGSVFGPVQSIISVLEAASKLMIGGLKCRGRAMVSYSSLADLKNYLKKWKMKLAWKHFYVLWIFKFSLFLCLILRTACRRTSLFSSLSIPMRIFSWWAKNPFHSSPWPWLELFGKSEHEEDVLSTILNGWIGLDVEVVGDVEADDQTDDLLLLCT